MILKRKQTSTEQAIDILKKGEYGTLSLIFKEAPYAIPINYYYNESENAIFMHTFIKGQKLDAIEKNSKVCFSVVSHYQVVPEKYSAVYESIIVIGKASIIREDNEKIKRLVELCERFAPRAVERRDDVIKRDLKNTAIIRVDIKEITGKRSRLDEI